MTIKTKIKILLLLYMSNNSNAPFVSSKKYPKVLGQSNSPFTDQRAVDPGGGSGGLGNVSYTDDKLFVNNDDGSTDLITNIDNADAIVTIKNDGGSLILNASQDTTTLSGDNLLNLFTNIGNVQIEAANDVEVKSVNDVKLEANNNVELLGGTDIDLSCANNINLLSILANINLKSDIEIKLDTPSINFDSNDCKIEANNNIQLRTSDIDLLSVNNINLLSDNNINLLSDNNINLNADTEIKIESANTIDIKSNDCKIETSSIGVFSSPYFEILDNVNNAKLECLRPVFTGGTDAFRCTGFGIFDMTGDSPTGIENEITQRWKTPVVLPVPGVNSGYIQVSNVPTGSDTQFLKCTTVGTGEPSNPKILEWAQIQSTDIQGGLSVTGLEIDYDTDTSVLVLSDPNLPPSTQIISTTSVVPGRTVLIEDVIVNGTTELSALGLSNSIFPPPLEGNTGYFAGLIGNSPPRVSLNPTTGLTNWFPGASFKITLAGEITKIGGYDDIRLKVYSNRGQSSENVLNSFTMITRSVTPPPQVGWNWVIDFTCRKINDGGILGVIATSSSFNYTDDTYVLETLGAIVSNTNSSFDTSVEQFLDCTIEFDYYNNSNNIKTTLCTIERIF